MTDQAPFDVTPAFPPVIERDVNGVRVKMVSARDLHAWLGVATRASKWIQRRLQALKLTEGLHYVETFSPGVGSKGVGRPRLETYLTLDAAHLIAVTERTAASDQLRASTIGHDAGGVRPRLEFFQDDIFQDDSARRDDAAASEESFAPRQPNELFFPPVVDRDIGGSVVQAVSGRDLHASLRVATKVPMWFERRLADFPFVEGRDYVMVSTANNAHYRPTLGTIMDISRRSDAHEVYFTLDAAKVIAMAERNAVGDAVRAYFIRCEKELWSVAAERAQRALDALHDDLRSLEGRAVQAEVRARRQADRVLELERDLSIAHRRIAVYDAENDVRRREADLATVYARLQAELAASRARQAAAIEAFLRESAMAAAQDHHDQDHHDQDHATRRADGPLDDEPQHDEREARPAEPIGPAGLPAGLSDDGLLDDGPLDDPLVGHRRDQASVAHELSDHGRAQAFVAGDGYDKRVVAPIEPTRRRRSRLRISEAKVVADIEDMLSVLASAGLRVVARTPPGATDPGTTQAANAIRRLISRWYRHNAEIILSALALNPHPIARTTMVIRPVSDLATSWWGAPADPRFTAVLIDFDFAALDAALRQRGVKTIHGRLRGFRDGIDIALCQAFGRERSSGNVVH